MFCNYCGAPNPDVASFCNKCGKKIAGAAPSAPVQAKPIAYDTEAAAVAMSSETAPAGVTMPRQEPRVIASGTLTPAARTEFTDGLTTEVRRQIDNRCIPAGIATWIATMIVIGGFSLSEFGQSWGLGIGLVASVVVAGIVSKLVRGFLEDKWVRPISALSDEMLVNRYNEAKADRRAARTRTAISWAVIAIIAVVVLVAWVAAQHH